LDKIATDEGAKQKVNPDTLKACLAKQDTTGVEASIAQGRALNIGATPTLFINGEKLGGALPKDQLWKVIDRELTVEGITPPPPPPPAATTPAPAAPAPAATTPPAK
jgi:predicted DsbA family dithiol-disulfide isomerase